MVVSIYRAFGKRLLVLLLSIVAVVATTAHAVDFSGQTIEIIVPASEGGGTDLWARTWAPLLGQHLPGNPTMVVRNVPGGSSMTGANHFQMHANPDGLTVFALAGSTTMAYLFRDARAQFNYDDWQPFLASPMGTVVYASPSLGVESHEDIANLRGQRLVYGSREATGTDLPMLLAFHMLDLNLIPVFGVSGRGEGRLGFERGEFNIDRQTTAAYVQQVTPMIEAGTAVPLFTFGFLNTEGNIVRDPAFPDLPHFGEVYEMLHGTAPEGIEWDAYKTFVGAGYGVSKAFVLPGATPPEIVEAFEEAARAVLADPEMLERLAEQTEGYEQEVGNNAVALLRQASTIDQEAEEWVRTWLTQNYDVRF